MVVSRLDFLPIPGLVQVIPLRGAIPLFHLLITYWISTYLRPNYFMPWSPSLLFTACLSALAVT